MDKLKISNKKKLSNASKKSGKLTISSVNTIKIEGIQDKIEKINYFKNINIINNNLMNKTYESIDEDKKIKTIKLKEYTPRFLKYSKYNSFNDNNNKIKDAIKFLAISIMKFLKVVNLLLLIILKMIIILIT